MLKQRADSLRKYGPDMELLQAEKGALHATRCRYAKRGGKAICPLALVVPFSKGARQSGKIRTKS